MATCLNSGAGATVVARSSSGNLSKGVGGPLAAVAKTLADAGVNGSDSSRGRCGIGEGSAGAGRENTVALPKAPAMNGACSRRGPGGMTPQPEQRQEQLPPSPRDGADKASSANGGSTVHQTSPPRPQQCTMNSTDKIASSTGVGDERREGGVDGVDAAGEAERGPKACGTTQELPRLPRPPPPPLDTATPSPSSLKPVGGGRSSPPPLNRAEKQQAAVPQGRASPLPQVAAETEPTPAGPHENTPARVDAPALPPPPSGSPSSKPAPAATTADATACEEAQASRKPAAVRSGAADAAPRPPDEGDTALQPGAAAATAKAAVEVVASPSVVTVSSCQEPPVAAAAEAPVAAAAEAPVAAAATSIPPGEDADATVTPAADVTPSPPRAAKRPRAEEESGDESSNSSSSRATGDGMDIDSKDVRGGSLDDDSKRQGAGGEETGGAGGKEGEGVADAGEDRPEAGPQAGAAPDGSSRKKVRTVVVVGAPPGEEIRPVAAAVPEPLLQVPEVSKADVGKLVLSETGAGTLTGVVEGFEETEDGLGAWSIRYENGDVARQDDCGELHDDMCSYFEFAGNAAAAAAKHVRTRRLPPRAQEEVRVGLLEQGKDKAGRRSVLGRGVSVFREKEILHEGWVTKYVQPTRDGEIDQWRVTFGAACESEHRDMDSFEVR
ncbi:unnamed protein product [Ectocarpus fasciculatus]